MSRTPMTEDVWLDQRWDRVHPPRRTFVVEWLHDHTSPRKMRLFACACARTVLDRFPNLEPVIETAEAFADERANHAALSQMRQVAYESLSSFEVAQDLSGGEGDGEPVTLHAHRGICGLTHDNIALSLIEFLHEPFPYRQMLHEIFGNPFRPVTIAPECLSWNRGLIRRMAEEIYEQRTFDECPILADALEEAGCNHAGLVAHLHEPQHHVRGCWALDAILERS